MRELDFLYYFKEFVSQGRSCTGETEIECSRVKKREQRVRRGGATGMYIALHVYS